MREETGGSIAVPSLGSMRNMEGYEEPPFYVGMHGTDRKFSMCKAARENIEDDKFLRSFDPRMTRRPVVSVQKDFLDCIKDVAVGAPAHMKIFVRNHSRVVPKVRRPCTHACQPIVSPQAHNVAMKQSL